MVVCQTENLNEMVRFHLWAMAFYIIFKFTISNLFVNINVWYKNDKTILPLLFRTFGHLAGERKSTYSRVDLREFCSDLIRYLRKLQKRGSLYIIFKGFGERFRKKRQTRFRLDKRRQFIMTRFTYARLRIRSIIDESAIPYNGCKSSQRLRKKLKHVPQFKQDPK